MIISIRIFPSIEIRNHTQYWKRNDLIYRKWISTIMNYNKINYILRTCDTRVYVFVVIIIPGALVVVGDVSLRLYFINETINNIIETIVVV